MLLVSLLAYQSELMLDVVAIGAPVPLAWPKSVPFPAGNEAVGVTVTVWSTTKVVVEMITWQAEASEPPRPEPEAKPEPDPLPLPLPLLDEPLPLEPDSTGITGAVAVGKEDLSEPSASDPESPDPLPMFELPVGAAPLPATGVSPS